jgi:starch synthase (maltosyl-transferring)
MTPAGPDRWQASFQVTHVGLHVYTAQGWVDRFRTWRRDLEKRFKAGKDLSVDFLIGAELINAATLRAAGVEASRLRMAASMLAVRDDPAALVQLALEPALLDLMDRFGERRHATMYHKPHEVVVDRLRARYSAWYEMFPRSASPTPGAHGTFADCEARLPYIAEMGFNVLYLPPIHPIGRSHRKGKNNAVRAEEGEPGSPWAIGSPEGGHKSIHPKLGTLEDFRRLVARAREQGIEVALDLALQCSPDHPYVKEHPEWFRKRPDGSVQYAENPPKEYQDIDPFDFETEHWQSLWLELKSIVDHWVAQGVEIFRVDNPHTKPFHFWEWLIREVKRENPNVLFLAEAFTRPKVMYELARLGFTQSYTYFTWRNSKYELTEYLTEISRPALRDIFRPNLWPNTPDILPEFLQNGGRPAFVVRLVLAATLAANYGIYGPAFELCEGRPRSAGSEEYLDSEKYEIRQWDLEQPQSLKSLISRVNQIRDQNPALQQDATLRFHTVDNEHILVYSKYLPDCRNAIVVAVNLDPFRTQGGWMELDLPALGFDGLQSFPVHELFSGDRYVWHGTRHFVELNPQHLSARIFQLHCSVKTEKDFEYFM